MHAIRLVSSPLKYAAEDGASHVSHIHSKQLFFTNTNSANGFLSLPLSPHNPIHRGMQLMQLLLLKHTVESR